MSFTANGTTISFRGTALGTVAQNVNLADEGTDIDTTCLGDSKTTSADGLPTEGMTIKILGSQVLGIARGQIGDLVATYPDGGGKTLSDMRLSKIVTDASVQSAVATDYTFVSDESGR